MKDKAYIHKLISKLENINQAKRGSIDINLVQKAIDYIQPTYAKLGQTAMNRLLTVAYMTTQYCTETETIITALLQDFYQVTGSSLAIIEQEFGLLVRQKLDKLSKLQIDHSLATIETIKKMREEDATDLLVIKLLGNIYEMQHIGLQHIKQQKEAALRSLRNYLPIAIYIELQEIEKELVTLCQPILRPTSKNNKPDSIFSPDFGLSDLKF